MYYLQTENIVKDYSNHRALDGVSISVPEGKIYGLLGPNGAGKSTLIRIINGITVADSGKVYLNGRLFQPGDVATIGYLPEERGLYKKMKVAEQAIYLARLRGVSKADAQSRLKYWMEKFQITDWANKKMEELSKGMQQKMQFIITVLHCPKLLIFDEPFSGFDPVNAQLVRNEILYLKQQGATILFSTHNMASVEEICDEIGLINHSKLVLQGQVDDVRESFRQGIFRLKAHIPADVGQAEAVIAQAPGCTLEGLEKAARYWTWNVKIDAAMPKHQVYEYFSTRFDLLSFEELIPSMNEIFIQAVGGAISEEELANISNTF